MLLGIVVVCVWSTPLAAVAVVPAGILVDMAMPLFTPSTVRGLSLPTVALRHVLEPDKLSQRMMPSGLARFP